MFAAEILTHSILMGVSDAVLGPNCARYQLNVAHILDRGPGGEAQILHRDELVWVHMPRPHPELQVASMVALVDFTADNGATLIVPGSHRWEHARQATPDEIIPANARRIGRHLSRIDHSCGWCQHHPRRLAQRSAPQLRARLAPYRGKPLPLDASRKGERPSRVAQELLGYAVHDAIDAGGGYLGAVDLRDPMEMFAHGELLPQNGALEE